MARSQATTAALYAELKKLLNLPDRLVALDLHLGVDEVPTVTCTYHPEVDSAALITRHFNLVEASPPKE